MRVRYVCTFCQLRKKANAHDRLLYRFFFSDDWRKSLPLKCSFSFFRALSLSRVKYTYMNKHGLDRRWYIWWWWRVFHVSEVNEVCWAHLCFKKERERETEKERERNIEVTSEQTTTIDNLISVDWLKEEEGEAEKLLISGERERRKKTSYHM